VGLRQLTIAKDNAKMNATREAYKLAADQCSYYLEHIIPLQNKLDKLIDDRKIEFFQKAKVTVGKDKIEVRNDSNKEFKEEIEPIAEDLLAVLNRMESFSIFFTSGVASESVAFSSVGATFCNTTISLLPIIARVSSDGNFQNVQKLFFVWHARVQLEKLRLNKEMLEKQLIYIEEKNIRPIGT
jgi:hypothetical protein